MKKYISFIISVLIIISCTIFVAANSGPTYWEGNPSSEILLIEQNTPITVENENLVFDFSVIDNPDTKEMYDEGYALGGRVTASYQMHNTSDELQVVQMAFPFVGRFYDLASQDILIASEGQALQYETYIGEQIGGRSGFTLEEKKSSFDFVNIVSSITNEIYKAENFEADEKGKLYTITITPETDQGINYAIEYEFNPKNTKIITDWEFNSVERDGDKMRITAWCYEPTAAEILVLGEDISFKEEAFLDGEQSQKTDLYTAETSTQEVALKDYLLRNIEVYMQNLQYELDGIYEYNYADLSEIQTYNVFAGTLDRSFAQNAGYSSTHDVIQGYSERIFTLVYNVEFPPRGTKNVSVSYKTYGTMDMRETGKPMYTFDYILNPASNWSDFKGFNLKVITPKQAPYIINSSIELNKENGNTYSASLDSLPDADLYFTLYEDANITLLDKGAGMMHRTFGYLYPLVLGAAIIIIAIWLSIAMYKRVTKRKAK